MISINMNNKNGHNQNIYVYLYYAKLIMKIGFIIIAHTGISFNIFIEALCFVLITIFVFIFML